MGRGYAYHAALTACSHSHMYLCLNNIDNVLNIAHVYQRMSALNTLEWQVAEVRNLHS